MPLLSAVIWAQPAPNSSLGLFMAVGVFAIFYFVLIMPMKRQRKQVQQMLGALKTGDRVLTQGGIRGVVVSVKDDTILLRVPPDQVKLELARGAVTQILSDTDATGSGK